VRGNGVDKLPGLWRMQNYTIERVVGEGSFGKALLCRRKGDQRRVIIKQVSIARMSSKDAQRTELEATLLSRLNHPNIVAFIDSFKTPSHLHIVMEYAEAGDLEGLVKNRKGKLIPQKEVLHLFVQIALALKHIHDRKILHRDLKSQNIFLTQAGIVKLGDFGVSRVLERTVDLAATQVGTPYYMPPEICNNTKYNSKCDIWSLGVILFELMTLSLPFKGSNMQQLLRNITSQAAPPVSSSYTAELRQILDSMLCKNQMRRPGINAVLKSPVLQNLFVHYLDENVKQQEFSHTVLHGAHILKSRPVGQVPNPISPPLNSKSPPTNQVSAPSVGQRNDYLEREKLLKERDDSRKLQRAAEERRERERERERLQAAAIQALRDVQREKEKDRERDIERARERLAAEKRAVELAKHRAAEREKQKEKERQREREKQKLVDLAREKAVEAERQLRARRERDLKIQQDHKDASPTNNCSPKVQPSISPPAEPTSARGLAAKRQANLQAYEREKEEQTKLARARLRNQMAIGHQPTKSPSIAALSPASARGALSPTPISRPSPKPTPVAQSKVDAMMVRDLKKMDDDDTDSSEERELLRRLGPPPPSSKTPRGKGLALEKPKSAASALDGLGVGQEWLSELEHRMGNLKVMY